MYFIQAFSVSDCQRLNFNETKIKQDHNKNIYQIYAYNFSIGEISVPARYNKDSSSINFINGIKYSLGTLYFAVKYLLFKNVY